MHQSYNSQTSKSLNEPSADKQWPICVVEVSKVVENKSPVKMLRSDTEQDVPTFDSNTTSIQSCFVLVEMVEQFKNRNKDFAKTVQ